jgi:hypothetical protein
MLERPDNARGIPAKREIGRLVDPRWLILLLIGFPLVVGLWLLFGMPIENWLHQRKFDTVLWKADVWDNEKKRQVYDGPWPPRLCMVDDLMASDRLLGMTKSQVVDLLGAPDTKTESIHNRRSLIGATFTYGLGPERSFIRIDSETLVLEFDAEDKVSSQFIHQD